MHLPWGSTAELAASRSRSMALVTWPARAEFCNKVVISSLFNFIAFAAVYPLSYLVRFDGAVPPQALDMMAATLPAVVGLKLAIFFALRAHCGWWEDTRSAGMVRVAGAATLGAAAVIVADRVCRSGTPILPSVILLDWAGTILLMGGLRGATRSWHAWHEPALTDRHPRRVPVLPESDSPPSGRLTALPRDVDITGLLFREPVRLDTRSVGEFLRGRVLLVTGAAGSIGSEICRQALAFRPRILILLDHWENGLFFLERELLGAADGVEVVPRVASITDAARLLATFDRFHPAVVVHAAAHKHVPMMEANPGEAVKTNVFGTRTLADEAVRAGVEAFVMISTDKAVNPTSVMGACKRAAEMYLQALAAEAPATRLVTVRLGNVLGSNGSVLPLFQEQIRRGGPVTVTHPDMTRFFMTIPEATRLVLQAGAFGRSGEILVPDMGEPVRVLDLARALIRLSGPTGGRQVEIAFTGLRPGEKLREELYGDREERLPTTHPGIFRAGQRPGQVPWPRDQLDRLARAVDSPDGEVLLALEGLVPEYRPDRRASLPHPIEAGRGG